MVKGAGFEIWRSLPLSGLLEIFLYLFTVFLISITVLNPFDTINKVLFDFIFIFLSDSRVK